jgi:hypothetical protein
MEWFRWYGGTFNDPKLQWVASKSCQTVASVLAVWVAVLERANGNELRGCCAGLDFESLDIALGLEDGATCDIYQTMTRKAMIIEGDMVAAWDKRQPKREDETAAERKKTYRDRVKLENENEQLRAQLLSLQSHNVPQCPTMSHDVTTEERRVEEKREEEPLKTQQQHASAVEQLAEAVEEHQQDLLRLFPEIDIPVALAKLLHHFRTSERLIDPWMIALKWFQREFKASAPQATARASPAGQKSKGVLREEAAIQAARETMELLEDMRNGTKQTGTGVDVVAGNDSRSRDRTAFSQTPSAVSEAFG